MKTPLQNSNRRGFTLVELLVTMTVFSALMSVLVVGLRTGASTWERVRNHQRATAEEQRALNQLQTDIRHIVFLDEETAPVVDAESENGSDTVQFTVLASRELRERGTPMTWARVTYHLEEGVEEGHLALVRTFEPFVGISAVSGLENTKTLLDDVHDFHMDYLNGEEQVPTWEPTDRVPPAVRVSLTTSRGRTLQMTAAVPFGALQGIAGQ